MLVDSNIIVYSLNSSSPKHKTAQEFLRAYKVENVIAAQNILESVRVLTHPKFSNPMTHKMATRALTAIMAVMPMIYPNHDTFPVAWALIKKHKLRADHVFDAYLAATAMTNDIFMIATDNEKDFRIFEELATYNPFVDHSN